MNINLAIEQDAPRLSALACANPFSAHWTEQDFAQEILQPCSKIYTLTDDNRNIIAFICYRLVAPSAELTNFAVDNNFLKQGLGSVLLGGSIKKIYAQGAREITLEVNVNNLAALKLYEKFLFKTVSLRKKFYNNNQDAAVMLLKL